jgi:hypothetical protein
MQVRQWGLQIREQQMKYSNVIGALLALVLGASACFADGTPTTQAAVVSAEQRYLKEQFLGMMENMEKAAKVLDQKDPDSAAAIRAAMKQANDAAIANDMDAVIHALSALQLNTGAATQGNVTSELRKMLEILRRGPQKSDPGDIDRAKEYLDALNIIIAGQRRDETISRMTANAGKFNQQMDELAARIAQIVAAQKTLMHQSDSVASDPQVKRLCDLLDELRRLIGQQDAVRLAATASTIERLPLVAQAQKQLGEQAATISGELADCAKDARFGQMLKAAGIDSGAPAQASADVTLAAGEIGKAVKALTNSTPREAASPQQQAIEDIKNAQQALAAAVAKAADTTPAGQLAIEQSRLEQQTLEVAQKVDDLTRQIGLDDPKGADQPAKDQPAPKDQPAQPTTQPAQRADQPAGLTDHPAGPGDNLHKAADHMNNAAGHLAGQEPKPAAGQQKEAIALLEEKQIELANLRDKMNQLAKLPTGEQKDDQDRLAGHTDKLARKMAQSGDSPKGDGQAGGAKEPAPGQQAVAKATTHQRTASSKLGQNDPAGANEKQKHAVEELEHAGIALQGWIDNMTQTQKSDDLAKIDAMLEQMLSRQQECSRATKTIFQKSGGKDVYQREDELQLKAISQDQGGIEQDAGKVLELIKREGDSTVFTPALKEVQTDLESVRKMLAGSKAGALTQRIQSDIENSLDNMLAAVRDKLAQIHRPKPPTPGPGPRPDPRPLPPGRERFIPPLAELKLLLTMQKDVNGRTELLDKQANSGTPKDELAGQNNVLAQREGMIRDMTQKIANEMHGGAPKGAPANDRNIPTTTGQFGPT